MFQVSSFKLQKMFELIVAIILLISVSGIVFISFRKMSDLVKLPQNGEGGAFFRGAVTSKIQNKISAVYLIFRRQIFLHKFLSWVKSLALKAELKIDSVLHSIRKKAQQIDKEIKDKK